MWKQKEDIQKQGKEEDKKKEIYKSVWFVGFMTYQPL